MSHPNLVDSNATFERDLVAHKFLLIVFWPLVTVSCHWNVAMSFWKHLFHAFHSGKFRNSLISVWIHFTRHRHTVLHFVWNISFETREYDDWETRFPAVYCIPSIIHGLTYYVIHNSRSTNKYSNPTTFHRTGFFVFWHLPG